MDISNIHREKENIVNSIMNLTHPSSALMIINILLILSTFSLLSICLLLLEHVKQDLSIVNILYVSLISPLLYITTMHYYT